MVVASGQNWKMKNVDKERCQKYIAPFGVAHALLLFS